MWNEASAFNFKLQLHYLPLAVNNPSKICMRFYFFRE
jgi:hypothetical protein